MKGVLDLTGITINISGVDNSFKRSNNAKRKQMYYDTINNNLLVFCPYGKRINNESIIKGTSPTALDYLVKFLNANKDLVVIWSKAENAGSEYTIYTKQDSGTLKDMKVNDVEAKVKGIVSHDNIGEHNVYMNGKIHTIAM